MAYIPISNTVPQYAASGSTLAAGYYLKAYEAGTTTALSMATDSTGGTTLAKCKLNSQGYPISIVSDDTSVFIPHFNEDYKLVLYPTETDADNNTFANADWVVDNLGTDTNTKQYADTITAAKALGLSVGDVIETAGYTTVGDGGAGQYKVVAGGTGTDDGGSYHDMSNGNQLNLISNENFINVKQFGAKGDGATDDTTAMSNAITYALTEYKDVYIPDGVYINSTSLTAITEEGITIYGDSRDVTGTTTGSIIKRTGATTNTIFSFSGNCRRSMLKDLVVDANSIALYGVQLAGPKCVLDNVTVRGGVTAGVGVTSFSTLIRECDIVFNDGNGVEYTSSTCNDSRILQGSISGNSKNGILVDATSSSANGFWFIGVNMENNCGDGDGVTNYAHVDLQPSIEYVFIKDMYHETDNSQTGFASQRFYRVGSGIRGFSMHNCYMSCSTSKELDYLIEIGASSYPVKITDTVGNNWNTAMIDNQSGASGSLILTNVTKLNATAPASDIVDYAGAPSTAGVSLTVLPNNATARISLTSDQSITSATLTDVLFATSVFDPTGLMVETANNGIRVYEEGYYLVSLSLGIYNSSASETVKSDILVGASASGDYRFAVPLATVVQSGNFCTIVKAEANDLIKARCGKSTNNFDIFGSANYSHLEVTKIAGAQN